MVFACKKDVETLYIYDVDDVNVTQDGVNKPNVKTTTEFISIAYSDLFNTTIDQNTLTDLSLSYAAFGDKKLIEDMIIRNFLNTTGTDIPSKSAMNADVEQFVEDTYRKFYNRDPSEFELWQVKDMIENDATVTPEIAYYAFMTSNEYRYY
ncbi:MAG: hypothetical protein COA57_10840 [Flavobacteriales bacterium]|nr:MAG: hypothetical protein COA57_10840 [Flavobacteriales bacterium]